MFHKMQAISGLAEELLAFPQEWLVQGCGRLVGWLVGWWVGLVGWLELIEYINSYPLLWTARSDPEIFATVF